MPLLPNALFLKILQEANGQERPFRQLELELLRYALKQLYGWECLHPESARVVSKRKGNWYCRQCGQLFYLTRILGQSKLMPVPDTWRVKEIDFGLLRPDLRGQNRDDVDGGESLEKEALK